MIIYRLKEYYEKRDWQVWLVKYPQMNKKNFEPYDYSKKRKFKVMYSMKSAEELLARAEKIKEKCRKNKEKKGGA